eukprot:scaffold36304_cov121-Isochrysis_galbana.AAC.9
MAGACASPVAVARASAGPQCAEVPARRCLTRSRRPACSSARARTARPSAALRAPHAAPAASAQPCRPHPSRELGWPTCAHRPAPSPPAGNTAPGALDRARIQPAAPEAGSRWRARPAMGAW